MRPGWTRRAAGAAVVEYRRPVGTMFELLVTDDPCVDGIDWQINLEGNHIVLGQTPSRRRGPLAWLINEAMLAAERAAHKAGLAVPDP